jgi:hypothetical protein
MQFRTRFLLAVIMVALMAACGCGGGPVYRPFTILYDLKVSLTDPAWDGKTIPTGQQCPAFGGQGATPGLSVDNIPPAANVLILEFSNKSHITLDRGGHGRIGYRFTPGTQTIDLPPIPGNTFDLPEPFFVIAAHRKPFQNKPGAYLPPCSGGEGNLYYLFVKAIRVPDSLEMPPEVLGQGKLFLGRY